MFDLIGKLGGSLVSAYQEKTFLDFVVQHFPIAACVIGALVIVAVILPIGPEWFRATKAIGMAIMAGGLVLMVGGFLWAGAIALGEAAGKVHDQGPGKAQAQPFQQRPADDLPDWKKTTG